jgi:hypothetical protein
MFDCVCEFVSRLTPQQVLQANAEYTHCNAYGCVDLTLATPPVHDRAFETLVFAALVAAAAVASAVRASATPQQC